MFRNADRGLEPSFKFNRLFFGAIICVLMVTWKIVSGKKRMKGTRAPPGPKGWPIIGNFFDMPSVDQYLTFVNWGKKYGMLICPAAFNYVDAGTGVDLRGRSRIESLGTAYTRTKLPSSNFRSPRQKKRNLF